MLTVTEARLALALAEGRLREAIANRDAPALERAVPAIEPARDAFAAAVKREAFEEAAQRFDSDKSRTWDGHAAAQSIRALAAKVST